MTTRKPRRRIPTGAIVVAAAAASVVGLAGPAAAQDRLASRPGRCVRVENQFGRLVATNNRVKAAFHRAQALQNRLIRAGRATVAHRLDTRLAHLRAIHAALVARAEAIAARVQGRCRDRVPTLSDL